MSLEYKFYLQRAPSNEQISRFLVEDSLPLGVTAVDVSTLATPRLLTFDQSISFSAIMYITFCIDSSLDDDHGYVGVHAALQETLKLLPELSGDVALVVNADAAVYVRHDGQLILNSAWGWNEYRLSLVTIPATSRELRFLIG